MSSCACASADSATPMASNMLPSDWSIATAKVCMTPISSEAKKAPANEPSPPTTTTTNTIAPSVSAIAGSVTKVLPPITPASPANPVPAPNTSMNTRGTLCPSASTISGCFKAA